MKLFSVILLDYYEKEVARVEFYGLEVHRRAPFPKEKRETKFRRGNLPAGIVAEIERKLANGIENGMTEDGKYHFTPAV